MILNDTGPRVALIDRSDSRQVDCVALAKLLPDEPLLSSWPCFTEAMHFTHRAGGIGAVRALWRMRQSGDLTLHDLLPNDCVRSEQLMDKYHDLPMDLADASLVALAERLGVRRIFTLDSDFLIYRLSDGSSLDVIP